MIGQKELLHLVKNSLVDYNVTMSCDSNIYKLSDKPRDINIFIPVRKRDKFIAPCLSYFESALKKTNLSARIIIIENDNSCECAKIIDTDLYDYMFFPTSVSYSDGLFAKSLAYNVGFIKAKRAKWNIFHDIDILVDQDYFQKLEGYLSKNPSWVQPYAGKRVLRIGSTSTGKIVKEPWKILDLPYLQDLTASMPGSPGGSIVVKSEDFINVGGYDPDLFYGYAPEDSFFWTKLELLYKPKQGFIGSHFLGSAVYADDPPIEVYHLNHPMQDGANSKFHIMIKVLEAFFSCPDDVRAEIIEYKKDLLKRFL